MYYIMFTFAWHRTMCNVDVTVVTVQSYSTYQVHSRAFISGPASVARSATRL